MDYYGLSRIILDDLGLLWIIVDHHYGLSWITVHCHGLSWIMKYPQASQGQGCDHCPEVWRRHGASHTLSQSWIIMDSGLSWVITDYGLFWIMMDSHKL
jgi:hypothetical protein